MRQQCRELCVSEFPKSREREVFAERFRKVWSRASPWEPLCSEGLLQTECSDERCQTGRLLQRDGCSMPGAPGSIPFFCPSVCSAQTTLYASGSRHQTVVMLQVLGADLGWFGLLWWSRGGCEPGILWVTLLPTVYLQSLGVVICENAAPSPPMLFLCGSSGHLAVGLLEATSHFHTQRPAEQPLGRHRSCLQVAFSPTFFWEKATSAVRATEKA